MEQVLERECSGGLDCPSCGVPGAFMHDGWTRMGCRECAASRQGRSCCDPPPPATARERVQRFVDAYAATRRDRVQVLDEVRLHDDPWPRELLLDDLRTLLAQTAPADPDSDPGSGERDGGPSEDDLFGDVIEDRCGA